MGVGPLQQRTMPEGIADVLRRAILTGELTPGQPLREMHLSSQLGVSRAPLREALRLLEEEGLVDRQAFKGSAVAIVSAQDVQEIAVVRQRVEPLAVHLGLQALQADDARELRSTIATLQKVTRAGDTAGSIDAHLAVHRLLYLKSGNAVLAEMWRSWESRLRLFWVVDHQSFARLTDVADSHERLLDLVVAGDLAALDVELGEHIHGSAAHGLPGHGRGAAAADAGSGE
jgi:DNA-binding GntR family transcriptional regulator